MTKVVPSQVVAFIDRVYPSLRDTPSAQIFSGDAAILAAVINLADDIPVELLTISGVDYTNFVFGLESMGAAIERWNYRGGDDPPRTHDHKSPLFLVRDALSKCPDQSPSPATTGLDFISDEALGESIRLDISSASNALGRNEFKASTVLAGAAIEALLLWKLQSKGVKAALPSMKSSPKRGPEHWYLSDYLEAAEILNLLKSETLTQIKQAQEFRNLIHPGRARRLAAACDRGTALAALSAVELIARDFRSR